MWPCWVAIEKTLIISVRVELPFLCIVALFLNCFVSHCVWILLKLQEPVGSRSSSYLLGRELCTVLLLLTGSQWVLMDGVVQNRHGEHSLQDSHAICPKPPSCGMIIIFPNDFHFLRARIHNWDWILMDCPAQSTIFRSFSSNNECCVPWICERLTDDKRFLKFYDMRVRLSYSTSTQTRTDFTLLFCLSVGGSVTDGCPLGNTS